MRQHGHPEHPTLMKGKHIIIGITGSIAEDFYEMPQELRNETLKRLPEEMRAAYELFRQNLERKV